MKRKVLIITPIIFFSLFLFFNSALANGSSGNVSGWAWSENIGWISFNCSNQGVCGTVNYGVNIAENKRFSGYAWSENIGWITFNESELSGCPQSPCRTELQLGTGEVSGWAKALAARDGWDGWIHFKGSNYGVLVDRSTAEFKNWAWGGDVVGWISFNCLNQGVCGTSNYKVITASGLFNQPPNASFACDASACNSSGCIAYTGCAFKFLNQSTDPDGRQDIEESQWDIFNYGSKPDLACTGTGAICDYTPPTGILTPGDYTVELFVRDKKSASDTETRQFTLRRDVVADFQCSLDNQTWRSCNSFQAAVGEKVYFKDTSTPSDGAASITNRSWTFQNGSPSSAGNDPNPSTKFQSSGSKNVTISVTDNNGRNDSQNYALNSKLPFPEFKEVPPSSLLDKFFANIGDGFLKLFFQKVASGFNF